MPERWNTIAHTKQLHIVPESRFELARWSFYIAYVIAIGRFPCFVWKFGIQIELCKWPFYKYASATLFFSLSPSLPSLVDTPTQTPTTLEKLKKSMQIRSMFVFASFFSLCGGCCVWFPSFCACKCAYHFGCCAFILAYHHILLTVFIQCHVILHVNLLKFIYKKGLIDGTTKTSRGGAWCVFLKKKSKRVSWHSMR